MRVVRSRSPIISALFVPALTFVLGTIATLAATLPAFSQTVADFYKNNTITISVGFSPGGSYDFYPRLFARHMGQYIPGHPNVIVQNMPGAGSLRAANYLYNLA